MNWHSKLFLLSKSRENGITISNDSVIDEVTFISVKGNAFNQETK
jgi:hypothetical protein